MAISPTAPGPAADPVPVGWQRLASLAGIAFAVLFVATVALSGGTTPEEGAPAGEWNTYASDNEDKARIAMILMAFTVYEFLMWLGYLRSVLGEGERALRGFNRMAYWPFAGGIVAITGLALGVFIAALSLTYEDAPGELIRGLNQLAAAGFSLAEAGFAAMLITTWFVVRLTRALPDWLGWVALVGGLCALLTFGTYLAEEFDNFFGVFYPLSWLALLVFVIGTSLDFNRRLGRARVD